MVGRRGFMYVDTIGDYNARDSLSSRTSIPVYENTVVNY